MYMFLRGGRIVSFLLLPERIKDRIAALVPDMPRLVNVSGQFFIFTGKAEHKAKGFGVGFQPDAFGGVRKFLAQLIVDGRTGDIDRQSGLVFAGAGIGNAFGGIFPAAFPHTVFVDFLLPFVRAEGRDSHEVEPFLKAGIEKLAQRIVGDHADTPLEIVDRC